MPPIEGSADGVASAPVTFDSLASDVLSADENQPAGDEQAAPAADAPADAGEGDLAAADDSGEGEEGAGEAEHATDDEVLDALAAIDRDTLTPDQQAQYDELMQARKLMQADYTKKTQKVAEQVKTIEQQVAEQVEARLAELAPQQPQQTPDAPDDSDIEAQLWVGLGEPVSIQAAIDAQGPEGLETYIAQQAAVIARREVLAAVQQVIAPQLSQVNQYVSEQQISQVDGILNAFAAANPDIAEVEGGVEKATQLVQIGMAEDLEAAAPMVRSFLFGPQREQRAAEIGMQAGAARAKAVKEAQTKFNVPSGATVPHAPAAALKGKSFDELAAIALSGEVDV